MRTIELKNPPDIAATIARLGLTMTADFVPFSKSRNKGEKSPSLNWLVTIWKDAPTDPTRKRRVVLTTDYSAGCGHCPAYKTSVKQMGGHNSIMRDGAIRFECENGRAAAVYDNANSPEGYTARQLNAKGAPLEPTIQDVLYSLVSDSSVLDAGGFESWASDLGYETDSRKAESIYKACLEIALKLRAAIGDAGLAELQTVFQDY